MVSISTGGGSSNARRPADNTSEPTTGMKRKPREAEVEGEQKGREDCEGATEPRAKRTVITGGEEMAPGEEQEQGEIEAVEQVQARSEDAADIVEEFDA